jgi:predicted enzyme related to lactoylglutathione lyase
MVERERYQDGEPCWADVTAADPRAAVDFYGSVFGWTFTESDNYLLAQLAGRNVAGISPPPPDPEPVPSAWNIYLTTHDLDATTRLVNQAGGKIMVGPMEIPDKGHLLYAADPTGAAFGVWQPGRHQGSQLYGEPGALCWTEINTREPDAADAFYRSLFGYEQQQLGDGMFDYTAWRLGDGEPVCGRLRMTEQWAGIAPHWMVYFAVEDTDAAADRVRLAGGQVQHGPFDSPHGRIAVFADPNGAVFSVID